MVTHNSSAVCTRSQREQPAIPYIAAWSGEVSMDTRVVVRAAGGGIGYADEVLSDRDDRGVLWARIASRPGWGRPELGRVHPVRQRRAMRRLLCQVCGGSADRGEEGVLWLLPDHRGDWSGWPEGMANTYPPLCVGCARLSVGVCPALRSGWVAVRARWCPLAGVRGLRYVSVGGSAVVVGSVVVGYEHPVAGWVRAFQLFRTLSECTIVTL